MDDFLRVVGFVLLSVVLAAVLKEWKSSVGILLITAVCTLIALGVLGYWVQIRSFLLRLQSISGVEAPLLQTLIKVLGISLIAEIASLICQDSGNGALSKVLGIFASVVIFVLSIPILESFLKLIEGILTHL